MIGVFVTLRMVYGRMIYVSAHSMKCCSKKGFTEYRHTGTGRINQVHGLIGREMGLSQSIRILLSLWRIGTHHWMICFLDKSDLDNTAGTTLSVKIVPGQLGPEHVTP